MTAIVFHLRHLFVDVCQMLPETVWICKIWDRTALEVLAKERRDKELPMKASSRYGTGMGLPLNEALFCISQSAIIVAKCGFCPCFCHPMIPIPMIGIWLLTVLSLDASAVTHRDSYYIKTAFYVGGRPEREAGTTGFPPTGQSAAEFKVLWSRTWRSCYNRS